MHESIERPQLGTGANSTPMAAADVRVDQFTTALRGHGRTRARRGLRR
jgi:hypothetical protein